MIEEVMKIEVPEGVQEAEYLLEKGSLDSIVPRNLFKGVLSELFAFHGIFHLNRIEEVYEKRIGMFLSIRFMESFCSIFYFTHFGLNHDQHNIGH